MSFGAGGGVGVGDGVGVCVMGVGVFVLIVGGVFVGVLGEQAASSLNNRMATRKQTPLSWALTRISSPHRRHFDVFLVALPLALVKLDI